MTIILLINLALVVALFFLTDSGLGETFNLITISRETTYIILGLSIGSVLLSFLYQEWVERLKIYEMEFEDNINLNKSMSMM